MWFIHWKRFLKKPKKKMKMKTLRFFEIIPSEDHRFYEEQERYFLRVQQPFCLNKYTILIGPVVCLCICLFASEIKSTSTRTKKKNNRVKRGALTRRPVVNIILLSFAISTPTWYPKFRRSKLIFSLLSLALFSSEKHNRLS